jgi:hypothetical protein
VDRCWEEIAGIAPASTKAFAKESAPHAPQVALEVIGKQGLRGLLRSFIGLLHVGDHIEVVLRKPMV